MGHFGNPGDFSVTSIGSGNVIIDIDDIRVGVVEAGHVGVGTPLVAPGRIVLVNPDAGCISPPLIGEVYDGAIGGVGRVDNFAPFEGASDLVSSEVARGGIGGIVVGWIYRLLTEGVAVVG